MTNFKQEIAKQIAKAINVNEKELETYKDPLVSCNVKVGISDVFNIFDIEPGDYITLIGDLTDIVEASNNGLSEIADEKYMNIPLQKSEIMLTKEFNIKNLKDLYNENIS